MVVADGVGGHAAGEVASNMAVATVREHLQGYGRQVTLAALTAAVQEANRRIHEEALRLQQHQRMGTTVAAAWCAGSRLLVAHVGDSRVYRLRQGRLESLTEDHSLVAEQFRKGLLSPDEAASSPLRHVVTRALGAEATVSVDARELSLQRDDRLLLCSDGLTTMVPEETISALVEASSGPMALCRRLVALANHNGGEDNITVVAAFCRGRDWRHRLKRLMTRIGG